LPHGRCGCGISMECLLGKLVESVKDGSVPVKAIDDAVRNILYVKFKLGLFEDPYVNPEYAAKIVHKDEHKQLACRLKGRYGAAEE